MINLIKQASIKGREVLKKYYKKNLKISYKTGPHDLVTQADQESQKIIIDFIKKESPKISQEMKIGFIGEEGIFENNDYTFIIDPLDGTTNFAAGIDHYCVSIGLAKKDEIIAGVVYDVIKNNLYWAELGKGAYKNDKKINIPNNRNLREAVLLIHFTSDPDKREKLINILQQTLEKLRTVRALGAVALDLCRLSEGVGDIVLNLNLNIWDIAAGALIIKEAGGEVLDLKGQRLVYDFIHNPHKKYQIVAAEKNILREFLTKI